MSYCTRTNIHTYTQQHIDCHKHPITEIVLKLTQIIQLKIFGRSDAKVTHRESVCVGVSESANDAGWQFNLLWRCTQKQEVKFRNEGEGARRNVCSLPFASGNKCRMDTKQQTDITVRLCTTEHLVFLFGSSFRFMSFHFHLVVLLFVAAHRFASSYRLSCI